MTVGKQRPTATQAGPASRTGVVDDPATLEDVIEEFDRVLRGLGISNTGPAALESREKLARVHRLACLSSVAGQISIGAGLDIARMHASLVVRSHPEKIGRLQ